MNIFSKKPIPEYIAEKIKKIPACYPLKLSTGY